MTSSGTGPDLYLWLLKGMGRGGGQGERCFSIPQGKPAALGQCEVAF